MRKRVDSVKGLRLSLGDRVVLAMPLGEWIRPATIALLATMGPESRPVTRAILPSDRWNAQGLEGAAEAVMPLGIAQLLAGKAGRFRATLYMLAEAGE